MPDETDWSEFIPPERQEALELSGKWRHGYIPLDAAALESKMKGNTGGKKWWSSADPGNGKHRRRMLTTKDVPSAKAQKRSKPSSPGSYQRGKISSMNGNHAATAAEIHRTQGMRGVNAKMAELRAKGQLSQEDKGLYEELRKIARNPPKANVPAAEMPKTGEGQRMLARKIGRANAAQAKASPPANPDLSPREQKIRNRISLIYKRLQRSSDGWASITDLRRELPQVKPDELSQILRKMDRERTIAVVPESNRKALTQADHNAAVRIGGDDNHLFRFH